MKTIITSILLLLTLNLFSQDFIVLQTKYNKAINKVTEPINKVYVQELEKLLDKEIKNGHSEEVLKISEELKKFSITNNIAPDIKLSLFLKKKWISNLGTVYIFNKDLTGEKEYFGKKTPFTWKTTVDDFVEIEDSGKVRYFKFINRSRGIYGESKDTLDKNLVSD